MFRRLRLGEREAVASRRAQLVARDDGTTLIFVAGAMLMICGFAAIAIDVGNRYAERRAGQTAADVGVMAGTIDLLDGVATIRDASMQYVRVNLPQSYSDVDWQTSWETCTDPTKNDGGYSFQGLPAPAGWGVATLDCLSMDPAGYLRVRVPDQFVQTSFGNVIGVSELQSTANAIARWGSRGPSGVLPFGLGSGVGDADHVCLSSAPTGLAGDPCEGASSGNFGTLKGRLYGNPAIPTPENCTSSPLGDVLALNIAAGLDHLVIPDPPNAAGEVRDECFNLLPKTLNTDVGFPNDGAEQGLATGPINQSPTLTPRLKQGSGTKRANPEGHNLDDVPLWDLFVFDSLASAPAGFPEECGNFNPGQPPQDWNGDGVIDGPQSWEHLQVCLEVYSGGGYNVLLPEDVKYSPRFAYIPQFHVSELGPGAKWHRIKRFRAVFLQGLWWKKGSDFLEFQPGEECVCDPAGNWGAVQLSALVIPDAALPEALRGTPPSGVVFDPYIADLWR